MHYKDGTPANAGDLVISESKYGPNGQHGVQTIGVVVHGASASSSCNGTISPLAKRNRSDLGWGPWVRVDSGGSDWSITFSDCRKVVHDDWEGAPPPTGGGPGDPKH